jgi:phosphopantothenoylcysteine decarboxylase/phosphopantothenate--cysteine ligase
VAHPLEGRTIALCVTGSIAAYKAVLVARLLVQAGASVVPVMTASATRFVGAPTLAGICGESVKTDMFDPRWPGEMHVDLGARADAVLVVPATADVLARLAEGRADDLVTALVLSAKGPVLAAPAMHPRMWDHPATRRNVEELRRLGRVTLVGPVDGLVASGEKGLGRMAEPEAIVEALCVLLGAGVSAGDLAGMKLVVTAGPTTEDLDPVRYLSNRSSGKMGFAVAERAAARGARVTLIAGPVALPTPKGVSRIDVRSALEMQKALAFVLGKDLSDADALVMTAAVADYRPRAVSPTKLKRTGEDLRIELVPNPDLLADIGARRTGSRPFLVGFALESQTRDAGVLSARQLESQTRDAGVLSARQLATEKGSALVELARQKLRKKKVDLVVANEAGDALSRDDNRATLVTESGEEAFGVMPKTELADLILDRVRDGGTGRVEGVMGDRE